MNNLIQNLIVYFLVGLAAGYVGYKLYQRFFTKRKHSPCEDCDGCALKEGFQEKKCPKDLFPPK